MGDEKVVKMYSQGGRMKGNGGGLHKLLTVLYSQLIICQQLRER